MAKRGEVRESARIESDSSKKYTRREFLKYGAKTGLVAAAYGTIGGFIGEAYRGARDFVSSGFNKYGNKSVDQDDATDALPDNNPRKMEKKVEDARISIFKKTLGFSDDKQAKVRGVIGVKNPKSYQPPEPQETRRGFLKSLLGIANTYPTETGVVAGATIGGVKTAIAGQSNYRINKKLARHEGVLQDLKTENELQRAEIELLKKSKLEKEAENGATESSTTMVVVGIVGLSLAMALTSKISTGNAINSVSNNNPLTTNIIIIGLFLSSLILVFSGIMRKFKKSKRLKRK